MDLVNVSIVAVDHLGSIVGVLTPLCSVSTLINYCCFYRGVLYLFVILNAFSLVFIFCHWYEP